MIAGKSFDYQVVITKNDVSVESAVGAVKVEDFAKSVESLGAYTLSNGEVTLKNNTLVLGETGTISEVKGKSWTDADLNFSNEKLLFESSDNSKVLVNAAGEITTVSAGNANIHGYCKRF